MIAHSHYPSIEPWVRSHLWQTALLVAAVGYLAVRLWKTLWKLLIVAAVIFAALWFYFHYFAR